MQLKDLQKIVQALAVKYVPDTEVEFSITGDDSRLQLSHVHHYREITTVVYPNDNTDGRVDTIFVVFCD